MGQNANSVGIAALPAFKRLPVNDQQVVLWKSEGKTSVQIAVLMKQELGIEREPETVRSWFRAGGRLEQAYLDVLAFSAESQLTEAQALLKLATGRAVNRIVRSIDSEDPQVALRAALAVIDKYVADPKTTVAVESLYSQEHVPVDSILAEEIRLANA